MKNPFKKQHSNNLLIAGIVGGAVAAGIITALIIRHRHELADAAANAKAHAQDYLEEKKNQFKKRKTDIDELKDIVEHA